MSERPIPEHLIKSLKGREQKGLLRKLNTKFPSIDFCSNDYLGFSKLGLINAKLRGTNDELRTNFGSTGSRLISGNSELIEDAEKQISLFHHSQSALIFNSGYDANVGLLSSVPQKTDLVLFDELCHASIYDGLRLSYSTHYKFKHNNVKHLRELILRHNSAFTTIYIVVESVYSMDGDTAPLLEIVELSKQHKNIFLIVDEAHAIGVFGKNGRGLCAALDIENEFFARVYTYGKAIGCHGAAIAGSEALRNYLINYARSFIYTTALPSDSIVAILTAYKLLIETNQRELLQENIGYFNTKISGHTELVSVSALSEILTKCFIKSQSSIHSFVVGSNKVADELEQTLAKKNIYAKAIKSPTVKEGTERVRFCLHAFNTKKEIDLLLSVLKDI